MQSPCDLWRQNYAKLAADPKLAFGCKRAAVGFGDLSTDREAQAAAGGGAGLF